MPNTANELVYLSDEQFQELVANGSIVVSGTTVTYNPDNIYVTPQQQPYIMPINGIPTSDLAEDAFASDVETQAIIDEYGVEEEEDSVLIETTFSSNGSLSGYPCFITSADADDIADVFTSGKSVIFHMPTAEGYTLIDIYAQLVAYEPAVSDSGTDYDQNFIIGGIRNESVNNYTTGVSVPSFSQTEVLANGKLAIVIYVD